METYLVDLTLYEPFDLPDEKDRDYKEIVNRLALKMREGIVELTDFDSVEGLEIDHDADGQIPVTCNETLFEILLTVDDSVDVFDGGEALYYYVAEALEKRNGEIVTAYTNEGDGCERTVARITLTDGE